MNLLFELDQQIDRLFDSVDRIVMMFPNHRFNMFEDILYKYNVFYKIVYEQLELSNIDIELILDTTHLRRNPTTEFLFQFANCIRTRMQLELDPASCFKPGYIDHFIIALNWSCEKVIKTIKKYIAFEEDQLNFLQHFLKQLEQFKIQLQKFQGEWRDNSFEIDSHAIPHERLDGEEYVEYEYLDYNYIPPAQ